MWNQTPEKQNGKQGKSCRGRTTGRMKIALPVAAIEIQNRHRPNHKNKNTNARTPDQSSGTGRKLNHFHPGGEAALERVQLLLHLGQSGKGLLIVLPGFQLTGAAAEGGKKLMG